MPNNADHVIDFVQQRRAGRFVDPVYVPENSPPEFPLVTDYSKHDRKDSEEEQEAHKSETARVKDKVSVNEAETEISFIVSGAADAGV